MSLTLEIVGPQAAQLGAAARKVFAGAGGSIGRAADNDWVIPDPYISSHHARIHFRGGKYLLEDTSTNGVFLKSPSNRLQKGQLQELQSGDRVFIDAYEIRVTLESQAAAGAAPIDFDPFVPPPVAPSSRPAAPLPIPDDPFGLGDPFTPPARTPPSVGGAYIPPSVGQSMELGDEFSGAQSADPMELLGFGDKPKPAAPAPRAADLAARSPLHDHYEPPEHTTPLPEPPDAVADALIPDDYDPVMDARVPASPPPAAAQPPAPRPAPGGQRPMTSAKAPAGVAPPPKPPVQPRQHVPPPSASPIPMTPPPATPTHRAPPSAPPPSAAFARRTPTPPPAPPAVESAPPPMRAKAPPPVTPPPARASSPPQQAAAQSAGHSDFQALLAAAGVHDAQLTPELAQNFGRILRVVVAGLMDVLRARGEIKNEFRLRATTFKVADNNPLKFSANVEDALHNLLVKRNSAYLGAVESFEDAFEDVRHHQMAMLAGVRLAFEGMLHAFEPERLQEDFDRQVKRGALLAVPAKLKYWDLYREKFAELNKDPEKAFGELFGEDFARAYEEQLERLKTASRNQKK